MKMIIPYLWFQDNLIEAVRLYTSIFPNTMINSQISLDNIVNPNAKITTISFQIAGQPFYALNGGPMYSFTPSISFFVACHDENELDELWKKLSDKGEILMELGKYPFSEKYGWLNDKFGLSWQISLNKRHQKITPFLMFSGDLYGKAIEALSFYTSVIPNSSVIDKENKVFSLNGLEFWLFDSVIKHAFSFTPAISFYISCDTQEEIDYFWNNLATGGEEKMCGWLSDKYGISWQIIPSVLDDYMSDHDGRRKQRVMEALLKMRKIDIQALQKSYLNR